MNSSGRITKVASLFTTSIEWTDIFIFNNSSKYLFRKDSSKQFYSKKKALQIDNYGDKSFESRHWYDIIILTAINGFTSTRLAN